MNLVLSNKAGFTLIELLVTIGILAVGMLGVSAMQINALRTSQGAIGRGEAALFVSSIAESMRANTPGVRAGEYTTTGAINTSSTFAVSGAVGSSEYIATTDMRNWLNDINTAWGNALGSTAQIACAGAAPFRNCVITLAWDDKGSKTQKQLTQNSTTTEPYTYVTRVIF